MKKICILLLAVVLFTTSILLVGCGSETQTPPDYTDQINKLLEKIDELLDKDPTINIDPNITLETPDYTNQINDLLAKIDELLAKENSPTDLTDLYAKLDGILAELQKTAPIFKQVMSIEYLSVWDTITLSSHFIFEIDFANEQAINEQDFDPTISVDIDNLTVNIEQDKSNLPDLIFVVGQAVHYRRGGDCYSATLTALAVNYVEVKVISDRQIIVKTVDGETHLTPEYFIIKCFTETAVQGGIA